MADAQECVETARLWLKSLKLRSQVSLLGQGQVWFLGLCTVLHVQLVASAVEQRGEKNDGVGWKKRSEILPPASADCALDCRLQRSGSRWTT